MWIETSAEVYAVIFAKHRKQLAPFASFTDSNGDGYEFSSGRPEVMTEWGFRDCEKPLLKIRQTKERASDKDWNCEYWIFAE